MVGRPALAQTGHVLNDIRTLFYYQEDLKRQVRAVRAELQKLSSETATGKAAVDSLTGVLVQLVEDYQRAASTEIAMIALRLDAIESSQSGGASSSSASVIWLPMVLSSGALIMSSLVLWVLLRGKRRRRSDPFKSNSHSFTNDDSTREHMVQHASESLTNNRLRDQPLSLGDDDVEGIRGHIPNKTLSRRSEIMEELGHKRSKSRKRDARSEQHAFRKRVLTDRASELILLTSRGKLSSSEREEAEKEIADILREMMALR